MTIPRLLLLVLALFTTAAAKPEDLAEALTGLVFDANPDINIPARIALSRWNASLRIFVFGHPDDQRAAARTAAILARDAGLPIVVLAVRSLTEGNPNVFLVVDENIAGAFRGPLKPMLQNAFLDDMVAVETYTEAVIAIRTCWTLPIWSAPDRLLLKAAIVGVDGRLPAAARRHCVARALTAALGLLGPGRDLPDSLFADSSTAERPGASDAVMLRLLYGPALKIGQTRQQTHDAALVALRTLATPKKRGK